MESVSMCVWASTLICDGYFSPRRSNELDRCVIWGAILAGIAVALVLVLPAVGAEAPISLDTAGKERAGYYNRVIMEETDNLDKLDKLDIPADLVDALLHRAEAYVALGHNPKALEDLNRALEFKLSENLENARRKATALGIRGNVYLRMGNVDCATKDLEESQKTAREKGFVDIEAANLIALGNLKAPADPAPRRRQPHEYWEEALADYKQAAKLATAERPDLAAQAYLNAGRIALQQAAQAYLKAGRIALQQQAFTDAQAYADMAKDHIIRISDRRQKASDLVSLALLLRDIDGVARTHAHVDEIREQLTLASKDDDYRVRSLALGHLARLYEESGNFDEALRKTRQALFFAQALDAPELEYQWQGQLGHQLSKRAKVGDSDAAKKAYHAAIESFARVQIHLASGGRGLDPRRFRRMIDPILTEYAKVLLEGRKTGEDETTQPDLKPLQAAFEKIKGVELQNYFQDECVIQLRSKKRKFEQEVFEKTAFLYTIALQDRLILLLQTPGRPIKLFPVPVGIDELAERAQKFRQDLEADRKNWKKEDINLAKEHNFYFYQKLIGPFSDELNVGACTKEEKEIDTIVYIPDGPLGLIPLAALFDDAQRKYLGECFAIATVPGLDLFDPEHDLNTRGIHPLVVGLTEDVKGYQPIPFVREEIKVLAGDPFDGTVIGGREFNFKRLDEVLGTRQYTVVHIATHGQFRSRPEDTFLVTADSKLHMNDLEKLIKPRRFRNKAIELITLSACETAAGDERTALGLAGVALKSGARSALASLWRVNDEATYQLMEKFYSYIKNEKISKAEALKKAQIDIRLKGKDDPKFWAAFLIIGNWL